jgi:hypothetical protein
LQVWAEEYFFVHYSIHTHYLPTIVEGAPFTLTGRDLITVNLCCIYWTIEEMLNWAKRKELISLGEKYRICKLPTTKVSRKKGLPVKNFCDKRVMSFAEKSSQ